MRLLFVADGRSPTSLSWLQHWIDKGEEIHLVSTYPCLPPGGLTSFKIIPVAMAGLAGSRSAQPGQKSSINLISSRQRNFLRKLRYYLGPVSAAAHKNQFLAHVKQIKPDLVHTLRIPFEGMLACELPAEIPLVISIWGNDLTLHATGSSLMSRFTRRTLARADGLIADTTRDLKLADAWDFNPDFPKLCVPGSGGIHIQEITSIDLVPLPEELTPGQVIVNPRGHRPGSLRQDVFFFSLPFIVEQLPSAMIVCPSMAGDAQAVEWMKLTGTHANVHLWPRLEQKQIWSLFRQSQVYVSPSIHDGTPNSFLEALACGCFPVVGDIDSFREWITPGKNGSLVDANSPRDLARAILEALKDPTLLSSAKKENARIIASRVDYQHCMAMTAAFYKNVIGTRT